MRLRLIGKKKTVVPRARAATKTGLGSLLKGVFRAVGVKPCGGCDERARKLDRASDKFRF